MITSAAEYQTITPVGIVNGGILPARDVAADGSARTLRAEDLDFAIEAVNERTPFTKAAGSPLAASPSTLASDRGLWLLDGSAYSLWGRVASIFEDDGVAAADETFSGIDFGRTRQAVLRPLSTMYPRGVEASALIQNGYFTSPALGMQRNPNHHGTFLGMRLFYYDLKRADRLVFGFNAPPTHIREPDSTNFTRVTGTYVEEYVSNTGAVAQRTYTGTTVDPTLVDVSYARTPYLPGDGTRRHALLTSRYTDAGTVEAVLPLAGLVRSARAVVLYRCAYNCASARYDFGSCDFVRSYDCTVANGKVLLPRAIWQLGINLVSYLASQVSGVSFPAEIVHTGTAPDSVYNWIEFGIQCFWIVADYNFRTEIRSLNWQWTP